MLVKYFTSCVQVDNSLTQSLHDLFTFWIQNLKMLLFTLCYCGFYIQLYLFCPNTLVFFCLCMLCFHYTLCCLGMHHTLGHHKGNIKKSKNLGQKIWIETKWAVTVKIKESLTWKIIIYNVNINCALYYCSNIILHIHSIFATNVLVHYKNRLRGFLFFCIS